MIVQNSVQTVYMMHNIWSGRALRYLSDIVQSTSAVIPPLALYVGRTCAFILQSGNMEWQFFRPMLCDLCSHLQLHVQYM